MNISLILFNKTKNYSTKYKIKINKLETKTNNPFHLNMNDLTNIVFWVKENQNKIKLVNKTFLKLGQIVSGNYIYKIFY